MTLPMNCKHCGGYGCNLCTPDAYKHGKTLQGESVRDRLVALRDELMNQRGLIVKDNSTCDQQGVNGAWNAGAICQIDVVVIDIDAIIAELDAVPIQNCHYCANDGFRWGIGDSCAPIKVPCPHCNHAQRQEPIPENSLETMDKE